MVEGAQARVDGRQQLLARCELLEGLGRVRVGAEPAGDEHLEAGLGGAVGERARRGHHTDVVEHRLAAVGRASGEVDLELPWQPLAVRMAEQEVGRRLRPRRDVEDLLRARAGQMAAHDVAHGVAARLARRQADRGHEAQDLGRLLERDEVELHVLTRGEVTPTPGVVVGDVRERVELLGGDATVRDLDPQHLGAPALTLAVHAVIQAEDAEGVLVDAAVEVLGDRAFEDVELFCDDRFERTGREIADVDRHKAAP